MTPRARAGIATLAVAVVLVVAFIVIRSDDGNAERRVAWTLTAAPRDAELEVEAVFGGSSCSEFDHWEVAETEAQIDIRAWASFDDGEGCTSDQVREPYAVAFDAPVSDRRLVGCEPGDDNADCTAVDRIP